MEVSSIVTSKRRSSNPSDSLTKLVLDRHCTRGLAMGLELGGSAVTLVTDSPAAPAAGLTVLSPEEATGTTIDGPVVFDNVKPALIRATACTGDKIIVSAYPAYLPCIDEIVLPPTDNDFLLSALYASYFAGAADMSKSSFTTLTKSQPESVHWINSPESQTMNWRTPRTTDGIASA